MGGIQAAERIDSEQSRSLATRKGTWHLYEEDFQVVLRQEEGHRIFRKGHERKGQDPKEGR